MDIEGTGNSEAEGIDNSNGVCVGDSEIEGIDNSNGVCVGDSEIEGTDNLDRYSVIGIGRRNCVDTEIRVL